MTTAQQGQSGQIRRFRPNRSSAPITRELYASTSDPTAIAFHLAAMFEDHDEPLTLAVLQERWGVGRPKATAARRFLIDAGYWAELRVPQDRGRWNTETVTHEAAFTFGDLLELALSVPAGTRIDCAAQRYIVSAEHELLPRVAENCDSEVTRANADRVSENCDSDVPGQTSADRQKTVTRSHQGKRRKRAGGAESQKTDTPPCKDMEVHEHHGDEHDDDVADFWDLMLAVVAIDRPGRKSVEPKIRAALDSGQWTPTALVDWVKQRLHSAGRSVQRPAGFVVSQLRGIPEQRPVDRPTVGVSEDDRIAACPRCDANGMFTGVNHRGHPFETKCRHEAA